MSQSAPSEETARFHQLVSEGDLQALQAAIQGGADVNAPGHVGRTPLMVAIAAKDLEKTKLLLQHGADPERTNDFNATALRWAVDHDFADGVRLLLSLGVDRGHHPRYPLKAINRDYPLPDVPLPAELKGVISDAEWRKTLEDGQASMREWGQNPTVEPMIADVQSLEVLQLFLEAGDDLNRAPREIQRELVGLKTGGELRVAASDYRQHKTPQFGTQNPQRMDFPFWQDMIRTGANAYTARVKFQDKAFASPGAVWCFDRFGSSLTPLGDGRLVQIAGEHEDYYDPDFNIYNDVVVHDGRGSFEIYGYPREVFPPTDFHSATLCQDGIYIVGCLGYVDERRPGFTPVFRLQIDTWEIESVATSGEMPGWVFEHRARYEPGRNVIAISGGQICVENKDGEQQLLPNEQRFELDLNQFAWRRVE